MANPFDRFDQQEASGNPFDRFDSTAKPESKKEALAWSDVPGKAAKNLLPSAGNFLSGIGQAIAHPVDTALSVGNIGYGAIRGAVPDSVGKLMDRIDGTANNPQVAAVTGNAREQTGQAGQFFKDRYGSAEGIKNTLATDPVGAASDLSTVLTGGAALAGKLPALAGVARRVGAVGDMVNPVSMAAKGVSKAAPVVGNATAGLIGGLGTHTGAESIKAAYGAGKRGGTTAETFADNMRGNVSMTDVLDDAKANIEAMGRAKSEAYRQNMSAVRSDNAVLSFDGIDNAVADAFKTATFKGQVKNTKAAQVQQDIASAIDEWKALDPTEFHTPEGLDALKQRIGGIVESVPFEQKTARLVGDKVYHAIKAEIIKQAPVYADTMKAYSEATDQIREIERALSLGKKASVDTAMRKLQSLTRNNVNTNYGNRLSLARELERQGGRELMPALAGQALSSWTPRGLGGAVAGGLGMGGYALGGMGAAIPALAVQSPRLMGEAALGAGRVAGGVEWGAGRVGGLLDQAGLDPSVTANILFQMGRLPPPSQ
jgi:hypothetical protein